MTIDITKIKPGDTVRLEFPEGHHYGPTTVEGQVRQVRQDPSGGPIALGAYWLRYEGGQRTEYAPFITSHTPAPKPLPTEEGFYIDREGDVWGITRDSGRLILVGETSLDADPADYAPFTRLVPETEVGRRKLVDREALAEVITRARTSPTPTNVQIADAVIEFLNEGETA